MKTSTFFLIVGLICIFLSCKKVDYSELGTSCELCAFASVTEGTYRGLMTWDSTSLTFPSGIILSDSVTVNVEHLFLNNNPYDDSTTMYFRTTWTRDQVGVINIDTIQIHNENGTVSFYSGYRISNHSHVTRSSRIKNGVYRKFSEYKSYYVGNLNILRIDATLIKL